MKVIVGAFFRHFASALSGVFLAIGVSQQEANTFLEASVPIVTGIVLYVLPLARSIYLKIKARA